MDDDLSFSVIEYDGDGFEVRRSIESVPLERPDRRLFEAGATRTGAKSIPDNTDSFALLFKMRVPSDQPAKRRLVPVWEVEKPWRRGWGWATWDGEVVCVRGLWIPRRRPKNPKVEVFVDHEQHFTAPGELLGPIQ